MNGRTPPQSSPAPTLQSVGAFPSGASGKQHNIHLETLTIGFCTDDPTITPNPPNAFSDTYIGNGLGRLDGNPARAEWKFTDAGEPGWKDTAQITIKDASSTTVLSVSGSLDKGNHQAH